MKCPVRRNKEGRKTKNKCWITGGRSIQTAKRIKVGVKSRPVIRNHPTLSFVT